MQRVDTAGSSLDYSATAQHLLHDLANGKDVLLVVEPAFGRMVLDTLSERLESQGARVLRVSGAVPGQLSVPASLEELGRETDGPGTLASDASECQAGASKTLGLAQGQIVFLVDGADLLDDCAFRAIERACSKAGLLLVFAGLPRMMALLDDAGSYRLRTRLLRGVRYTAVDETSDPPGRAHGPLASGRPKPVGVLAIGGACVLLLGTLGIVTVWAFDPDQGEVPDVAQVATAPVLATKALFQPRSDADAHPAPITVSSSSDNEPLQRDLPFPDTSTNKAEDVPRPAKRQADSATRERRVSIHSKHTARNQAPKRFVGEYIGTVAVGPDGVRSFQYRP